MTLPDITFSGTRRSPDTMDHDTSIPSMGRPLHLLTFFTSKTPVWTLTALADASGLPKASCLRAIRILEQFQFLSRDGKTYRLGSQFLRLSADSQATSPMRRIALPHLTQLHHASHGPVSWSVLAEPDAFTLDVMGTDERTSQWSHPGQPVDLTRGAVARILLAFASLDTRRAVLDAEQLLADQSRVNVLDDLARQAWLALDTVNNGHLEVAAPVFQANGALAGALGVLLLPLSSRTRVEFVLDLVSDAATRMSRDLGYTRAWRGNAPYALRVHERLGVMAFDETHVGSDLVNYPSH